MGLALVLLPIGATCHDLHTNTMARLWQSGPGTILINGKMVLHPLIRPLRVQHDKSRIIWMEYSS